MGDEQKEMMMEIKIKKKERTKAEECCKIAIVTKRKYKFVYKRKGEKFAKKKKEE